MGDNDLGSTPPSHGGDGMTVKECREHANKVWLKAKVQLMLKSLEQCGCSKSINVEKCQEHNLPAYYDTKNGIKLCCNGVRNYDDVERVFLHELIHAYDICRAPNINWKNIHNRACTEVRAYHLCTDFEPEMVKNGAISSVQAYTHHSEAEAKSAVEAVWNTCYYDLAPIVGRDQINWGPGENDKE